MKNRKFLNIIYILFIIILVCFFYVYEYKNSTIDKKILDKTWYSYNTNNGYYDTFSISNNKIIYNKTDDTSNIYNTCSEYNYNKKNKSFNLDCGKNIVIDEITDNKLVLIIDEKKKIFFDNLNDTLNTEFSSYFSRSISEYKSDMSRVTDLIKIDSNEIQNLFLENEYSKFIFTGDKCTSIECSISLDIIERWVTNTENVYYIDSSNLENETLIKLNKLDNKFSVNNNYYNNVYPLVLITYNGQILDSYYIKCNGFNCKNNENNEF